MSISAKEEVWLTRSNIIEWVVSADCVPVTDLSATTQAVVCVDGAEVDSAVVGSSVIWWTDSVTDKVLADGTTFTGDVVRVRLGLVSTLEAGEYAGCRLVLYNPTYPDGLVVSDDIFITVYDPCTP